MSHKFPALVIPSSTTAWTTRRSRRSLSNGCLMWSMVWVKRCYSEKSKNLNKLSNIPITWWKCRSWKTSSQLCRKTLKYSRTLDCACSVILNFLDKMTSSRWQATNSKLCIQVYLILIRYYTTRIRTFSNSFKTSFILSSSRKFKFGQSLSEKVNHTMYQDENPHRCLLSLQI